MMYKIDKTDKNLSDIMPKIESVMDNIFRDALDMAVNKDVNNIIFEIKQG